MKNKLLVIFFLIGFFLLPVLFNDAHATSCNTLLASDSIIEANCTFDGTVDGYDDGTGGTNTTALTIDNAQNPCTTPATLTINVDQTVAAGTITIACGAVAISTSVGTQKLAVGMPLWMVDADADTYSATTTVYAQASPPANGVRKSTITSATVDCCDSDLNAHPNQTQPYTVATACGGYDYNCDLSDTPQYNTLYSCSTTGCDAYHDTVVTGFNGSVAACGTSSANNYRTASIAGTCAGNNTCAYTSSTVTQSCL